ncbi:MAG: C-terminal helicase domain-containing protein [Limisphaerales bacterium]
MHVLAALTRLRQVCCHPSLVGSDTASGKTETLFELLDPLIADGQKVWVFSQFVQMLQCSKKDCAARNIPTHMLTGQTKDRQAVVNAFPRRQGAGVFLLSLRAAGTGLNLTNASYVVLYDPWWNPAVEAQAIDRSHRIGQTPDRERLPPHRARHGRGKNLGTATEQGADHRRRARRGRLRPQPHDDGFGVFVCGGLNPK